MRIVVDQNIPFGKEAFAEAGEVVRIPGREIGYQDLKETSILIVRSITQVDSSLLRDSPVRFVGTCTIGTDHLDIPWLDSRGITWASAAGCNARSVAEYVIAALAFAHLGRRIDLAARPQVGIVGAGRVGRAVTEALRSLGLPVLLNDPPRAEREGSFGFVEIDELMEDCDIVCGHLPLVRGGMHPTSGLLDNNRLGRIPRNGIFINAGRGATCSSDSLRRILATRPDLSLVLDVWDPEPSFPADIARSSLLSTPHIAGYSFEGKVEGTRLVREILGKREGWPNWVPPETETASLRLPESVGLDSDPWDSLCHLVLAAYDIGNDSDRMRNTLDLSVEERSLAFDQLRKTYPVRREFRIRAIENWNRLPELAKPMAENMGFRPL